MELTGHDKQLYLDATDLTLERSNTSLECWVKSSLSWKSYDVVETSSNGVLLCDRKIYQKKQRWIWGNDDYEN